jgi:hypothetical protein
MDPAGWIVVVLMLTIGMPNIVFDPKRLVVPVRIAGFGRQVRQRIRRGTRRHRLHRDAVGDTIGSVEHVHVTGNGVADDNQADAIRTPALGRLPFGASSARFQSVAATAVRSRSMYLGETPEQPGPVPQPRQEIFSEAQCPSIKMKARTRVTAIASATSSATERSHHKRTGVSRSCA